MAREKQGREHEFDALWRSKPAVVDAIRFMTLVWGVGMIAENTIRFWLIDVATADHAVKLSNLVRYVAYGALTVWTIFYRRRFISRQPA